MVLVNGADEWCQQDEAEQVRDTAPSLERWWQLTGLEQAYTKKVKSKL